ncbi:MFS transporter [Corynebacterium anserum]|uniref:MFS transporter n=1 Tax=Corynebacterium anserum TaxID=2684406 RepID=UPI001FE72E57|nr:MFS transporter [Corynebacterium anserum]
MSSPHRPHDSHGLASTTKKRRGESSRTSLLITFSHRVLGEPPASELPNVPENAARFSLGFGSQNVGDQIISAKSTLPWFLTSVGAPAWIMPLLVPIRESGSMLPQAALRPWLQRQARRLPLMQVGTIGQGICCLVMALAALFTSGLTAGLIFLAALAGLSLFRALVSLASKDVQGRTMPKGFRGRVTGFSTTVSGAVTIVVGLILAVLHGGLTPRLFAVLFGVAALSWFASYVLFSRIKEPASEPTQTDISLSTIVGDIIDLVRSDAPFRNFVGVRSLMLVSALSPSFLVVLSSESSSADANTISSASLGGLGLFVLAGGLASLLAGRVSGALSDTSSKNTLTGAAVFASVVLAATIAVAELWESSLGWWLPLAFFLISVAHAAIRVARSTYVVDMAEGDLRTRYVSVANTLMGLILLVVGALTSVLAIAGTLWALGALAFLGLIGAFMAVRLPEVSRGT